MALTPEQESAVISRYLVLADQERLERSHASPNFEGTTPNKHKSTEMARSHSILKTSDKINHNAKNKLKDNITRRITFNPSSHARETLNLPPSKVLQRRNYLEATATATAITTRTSTAIKLQHPTHSRSRMKRLKISTQTRGVSLEPPWNGRSNECLYSRIQPTLLKKSLKQ
jgi:hypothetical protein